MKFFGESGHHRTLRPGLDLWLGSTWSPPPRLVLQGIYVNGASSVHAERQGELVRTTVAFDTDQHFRQIVDRIIQPQNLNTDSLVVTCTLAGSTWVLAAIQPDASNHLPL